MTLLDSSTRGHDQEPQFTHMVIPVSTLRVDEVLDFNLYLPGSGASAPVLYRSAETPFGEDARRRLREAGQESLLILSSDRSSYSRYLERNLSQIVGDASLSLEERTATLYFTAKELMQDLMADPRAGDLMERSANVVDHTVGMLFNESQSFRHLIGITSSDYYTYTHSVNVFVFSTALAQRLGHDEATLHEFGQGALLHDIGKSLVPLDVLNAKGKLDDAQWVEMKLHPVHGWNILKEQGVESEMVLDVTRHHHEKLNGKGYPDGLAGDEISHWARISTIADIFDALTTRRSYKNALDSFPSLQLMHEHMKDEIDMDYFRCFVDLMAHP